MNIDALAPRLAKSFPRCTKVSETSDIFRCERVYKDTPRSVYFFKAGSDVPTSEELSRIHQDVVGPSYFLAKDASRWNHFLVFVAEDQRRTSLEFQAKCRQFEANKDYARKLVVYDSELDEFIDRSIKVADADGPARSVVAVWTQKLAAADLAAIETDTARAPLIRAIRKGEIKPSTTAAAAPPPADAPKKPDSVPFIERFVLQRFGGRSIAGTFEFGRVNLIRGPNGSGKTSLMEAIEHYFCGSTHRSKGEREDLQAEALFSGASNPAVFSLRDNNFYQDLDQHWYGRTINRGNRLWEGFSRFNFLNTDAAVHFSNDDDQQNLTDELSKIALGPEAAFTWNRIEAFEQDIVRELGPIESTLAGLNRTITAATARESALKTASPQIEAGVAGIRKALERLAWPPLPPSITIPPDAVWFLQFGCLRDFVSGIADLERVGSADELGRMVADREKDLWQLQALQDAANFERGQEASLRNGRLAKQATLSRLQRLSQLLDSGLARWVAEEHRLNTDLGRVSQSIIALADLDVLEVAARDFDRLSNSPDQFRVDVVEQLTSLRDKEQALESERTAIARQLAEIDNIVTQIRSLGQEYAEHAPHGQECPLCRTPMDMAELLRRIQAVSNQSAHTARLEEIARDVSAIQTIAKKLESASLTIKQISDQAGYELQSTMAELIQTCRKVHGQHQSISTELTLARSQRETMEQLGFDVSELSELVSYFESAPEWGQLSATNAKHVLQLTEALAREVTALQLQEAAVQAALAETARKLQVLLSIHRVADEEALRRDLNDGIRALAAALAAFDELPLPVKQLFANKLPDLADLCRKAIKALNDLSDQVQGELARNKELQQLKGQLVKEQAEQTGLTEERDRLQKAMEVLRDIKQDHSLESGLSSFLKSNLMSIDQIFSKIHVPRELRLSALDGGELERFGYERRVKLTQISTGQRAALMLSVFLTLNLSLRQGPPQVLIDDPIAHIDDLNSLSFLDYLADMAESGKRQIFFATANEKLANLFQKKMEFLGKDLHTIELPLAGH